MLGRRGFGEAQMVLQWASVVGPGLASETLPVKLSFGRGERVDGTLHLRVTSGAAPTVTHLEPVLIERINAFFGYRAVGRLALRQGPLPGAASARPERRRLTRAEATGLAASVAAIDDPDLRAALYRLGHAVLGEAAARPAAANRLPGLEGDTLASPIESR